MAAPPVRDRDDLYAVPPTEFTRARNALVARLRERGEHAEAREVARLCKPTAVVSAINRVARDASAVVERLIKSVERLRRAQTRAVDDLPKARAAYRAALARLVERVGDATQKPAVGRAPELIRRIEETNWSLAELVARPSRNGSTATRGHGVAETRDDRRSLSSEVHESRRRGRRRKVDPVSEGV